MKVLLIKTSSLGDIIHMLPAVTDAARFVPSVRFDWVVEEQFAELPLLHPQVERVIPVALRRWRNNLLQAWRSGEWQHFKTQLQAQEYDVIIDAQGLLKSAYICWFARGKKCGFDWHSIWEKLATLAYQQRYRVEPAQHAVIRMRKLLAQIFTYQLTDMPLNYGLTSDNIQPSTLNLDNYIVFLHGTSWHTKQWPVEYWCELAQTIPAHYSIVLPWGNTSEQAVAQNIADKVKHAMVLPRQSLTNLVSVLAKAKAVISMDTGLGHLATALNVPTIALYGPTDAKLTGTYGDATQHITAAFPSCVPCLKATCYYRGERRSHLEPPCMASVEPANVWQVLQRIVHE